MNTYANENFVMGGIISIWKHRDLFLLLYNRPYLGNANRNRQIFNFHAYKTRSFRRTFTASIWACCWTLWRE